jgi:hypothetical protein
VFPRSSKDGVRSFCTRFGWNCCRAWTFIAINMPVTVKFIVLVWSCLDVNASSLSSSLSSCIDCVSSWICSNRLRLNANKTEVTWCTSVRRLSQLPINPLWITRTLINPVSAVRDLGVFIDSDLSASTHVRRTVSRCFAALRQLRRYVTDDCFWTLVVSLVHSRLDYGNFVLIGSPAYQQWRLR